ncbi:O-acetyltransferase OatA [Novipirellula galeiformis]|uniref:O-acetyltransferase OatA n=1 Tax=Novipirellula galeiformis TaxID=2528004 RepID=A0A5C6C9D7_9BACT|nr:acyltransferase [Novipirellula galeiformis]TWU21210.1 O-acetyltransferase OatA [Novipirellula galeiformis]
MRNGFLDFLRALAIVLVVNCHIASTIRFQDASVNSTFLRSLGVGGHGVDLFFVLSGWLLGGLLFRELKTTGTIRLGRFYGRRWLRTLPAYFAILLFTLAQRGMNGNLELIDSSYFVFLQTYAFDKTLFFGVSWSLCVEEHFYLIIAPLLLWFGSCRRGAMLVIATLLILPLMFRGLGWYGSGTQTHVRIDQCAAGVGLALLSTHATLVWHRLQRFVPLAAAVGLAAFLGAMIARGTDSGIEFPLIAYTLIFASWVSLSDHSDFWRRFGRSQPLIGYLATRSYAVYLVHIEAIAIANRLGFESKLMFTFAIWVLSLLLAELLYRLVELPGMTLREQIPSLRSKTAETAAAMKLATPATTELGPLETDASTT